MTDICCSVALTVLDGADDPKALLDALSKVTHFGPGGRKDMLPLPLWLADKIDGNSYLADLANMALGHFGSLQN